MPPAPRDRPRRLTAAQLADHLSLDGPEVRRIVLALRRMVLGSAPAADEAVRFGCLCYFRPDEPFGAIGGNICMIEVRRRGAGAGAVSLSFLQGARLPDPGRLLRGRGKAKRSLLIPNMAATTTAPVRALLRAAAKRTGAGAIRRPARAG